jgi:hypothetical protein
MRRIVSSALPHRRPRGALGFVPLLSLIAILFVPPAGADFLEQLVGEVSEERISDTIASLEYARYTPAALKEASGYIAGQFASNGYTVRLQPISISENVVARLPGTIHPEQVFVVGAHFDTASSTPGADDNASGVAAVLEIARVLRNLRFPYSVDFVAYTLEEYPPCFQGSREYVRLAGLQGEQIIGSICFDMIGYTCDAVGCQVPYYGIPGCLQLDREGVNVGRYAAVLATDASAELLENCGAVAQAYVPLLERLTMQVAGDGTCYPNSRRSDQVPFWDASLPALEFFDTYGDRNPNYHGSGDRLSTLDLPFCRRITQVALAMTVLPGLSDVADARDLAGTLAVYPTPSRSDTRIRFELGRPGPVRLSVLDVTGRIRRVLAARDWPAGTHDWVWDGRDGAGRPVARGTYLIRLESGSGSETRKAILLP